MITSAKVVIDGMTFDFVAIQQRAGTSVGIKIDGTDVEHVYMSPRCATALGLLLQEMGSEVDE